MAKTQRRKTWTKADEEAAEYHRVLELELRERVRVLEHQLNERNEECQDHQREVRKVNRQNEILQDHGMVLQSDRDRLTCALEVACRRLASPSADQDWTRAGWRTSNRMTAAAQNEYTALAAQPVKGKDRL